MAEQLTEQQAAPQVPAGVNPDTGEVSLQAQMDELKSRIAFMQQQGAAQGWDGNRAAQRNALQTQLTRLELQAAGGQGRGDGRELHLSRAGALWTGPLELPVVFPVRFP